MVNERATAELPKFTVGGPRRGWPAKSLWVGYVVLFGASAYFPISYLADVLFGDASVTSSTVVQMELWRLLGFIFSITLVVLIFFFACFLIVLESYRIELEEEVVRVRRHLFSPEKQISPSNLKLVFIGQNWPFGKVDEIPIEEASLEEVQDSYRFREVHLRLPEGGIVRMNEHDRNVEQFVSLMGSEAGV